MSKKIPMSKKKRKKLLILGNNQIRILWNILALFYGLDPNDFNDAKDFVNFLEDEQIFEEFVDFCEEKEKE